MHPLSAVLFACFVPLAQAAAQGSDALASARKSFLEHQAGAPTLDGAAADVQLGCPRPCADEADVKVYIAKVELIARGLGLGGGQVARAVEHYAPGGRPRLRSGPAGAQSTAGRALEAAAIQSLRAGEQRAPQTRARLDRRARAMEEALGRTSTVDAAGGFAVRAGQRGPRPTTEQLNAVPATQAPILQGLATAAPPAAAPKPAKSTRWTSDAYGITVHVKDREQPLTFRKGSDAIKAIGGLPDGSVTKVVFYGHGGPGLQTVGDFDLDAGRTGEIMKGKMAPGGVVLFAGCNTSSVGTETRVNPFYGLSTVVRRLMYFSIPYLADRLDGVSAADARKQWEGEWDKDLARDTSLKMRGSVVCGYRTFGLPPGRTPGVTKLLGNQEATTPGYVAGVKACFLDGREVKAP